MAFYRPIAKQQGKRHCPVHHTIHSIDSLKLLQEVNKQAAKHDRIIRVLLEIHIAQEEAKHGFSPDECRELLYNQFARSPSYIRICGLMGMATNTDDTSLIKMSFIISMNFH